MAFNLNNFVIDRVVKAVAFDTSDDTKILFSINQVTNPSLNVTSETAEAVDALGTPVAIFNRAKSCEFSAENALFDMGLMAVQAGGEVASATANNTITVPAFETIAIADYQASAYSLKKTPTKDDEGNVIVKAYAVRNDGTIVSDVLTPGAEAAVDTYVLDTANTPVKLVPPTTLSTADASQIMIVYQYEADGTEKNGAVSVINSAQNFPKACKLVVEVLGCDICDQTDLIYAYLIFPNFKLSSDFDWGMSTDSTHPFSGRAMQSYCEADKKLYQIIIPEA